MLEGVARRLLQAVFGSGADISGANPLPVSGVVSAANLTIDSFTDTAANIDPLVVRSSATDAFKAAKVHCHFDAATSNPITIALVAAAGAAYDKPLQVITMGASQDADYYFPEGAKFEAGDVITVAWTDDTGGVWGVQIGWEE